MLFTLLAFAVALGTLIIFHELGHYWVARLCGVKVLRFSVGFGKVILRRTDRHGTEWAVSALPLGGYVKMQDDPPAGASPAEVAGAFNSKPVGQRIAIVAAGPIFNLILAVFLYAGLNMAGTEEPVAVIAQPAADTPAARAGLLSGDRILAIDGEEVASWSDARWRLMDVMATGGSARIEVKTPAGAVQQRELVLPSNTMDPAGGDPLAAAGVRLAQPKPAVRVVNDGGEGQAAGLRTGDLILAVNGVPTPDTGALVRQIQESAGKTLALTLARDGANISLNATPRAETVNGQVIGRLGVQLGGDVPMVTVRYGVFESLWKGAVRTWDTAWFSLRMMGRMITGDVSWRNVSGPVTIADYAGQTARIGIVAYIAYIALISISLGVLNLLPIPMLDGGHLLYYLVEIVRGSPPPARWIDIGQRAGIGLLASLMGLALFNDFTRLFT
ncbi:RIP metalloprotease RseP [Achromobacter sp. K91]|jgi:regulator of sigma E protease|uniref:Zinc metalloprotease n=2 Tax=Achromobacter aegrifaciens TaxID=1287736 RepID=A0AAD2KL74_ACHAE|nr:MULTISPECIES: RIP metalloprotease RseP [Achromobacter]MBD9379838.1 RIP metalloprotease RseP [Achromobacter sp. ACM02]MBD9418216.1 RIP metalloprotease RseP [Achromobacter sp. ACM04]MBD9428610.1 RIP metalloprotease RseP [Achromobacter sp. ACM03]MBD9473289.1 RIP metalloprotease RseP [Achromobacter sp. ACM01]MDQ1759955.1 RIP metalloprotease RseP [Achromobacter aegrifaciens]